MATLYGTQYDAAYVTQPTSKIAPGDVSGHKKVAYFDYVVTAAPTNGDVLKLCKLPKGARVLDVVMSFPDLGTGGALNVGINGGTNAGETADADAFLVNVDVATAADCVSMKSQMEAGGSNNGWLKHLADEVDVQIDIATAWTATSGTIKGYVEYVTI
jgi:hypothetical protein